MCREEFKKIEGWDKTLLSCPFCGAAAEMWEYSPDEHTHTKVVCCSESGGESGYECPMYLPSDGFYKSTKTEARKIWNARS